MDVKTVTHSTPSFNESLKQGVQRFGHAITKIALKVGETMEKTNHAIARAAARVWTACKPYIAKAWAFIASPLGGAIILASTAITAINCSNSTDESVKKFSLQSLALIAAVGSGALFFLAR